MEDLEYRILRRDRQREDFNKQYGGHSEDQLYRARSERPAKRKSGIIVRHRKNQRGEPGRNENKKLSGLWWSFSRYSEEPQGIESHERPKINSPASGRKTSRSGEKARRAKHNCQMSESLLLLPILTTKFLRFDFPQLHSSTRKDFQLLKFSDSLTPVLSKDLHLNLTS